MRQAKNLLYGRRQAPQIDPRAGQLSRAEQLLDQNCDTTMAARYLLAYPEDIIDNRRLDNFLLAVALGKERLETAINEPTRKEPLRQSLNSSELRFNYRNEEEVSYLSDRLKSYQISDIKERLSNDLVSNPRPGPIALAFLASSSLERQLALYYRNYHSQAPLIDALEKHLSWRLLGRAETHGRLVLKELDLVDHINPEIGSDGAKLHYLFANDYTLCDPDLAVGRACRGLWRDKPELRCPRCSAAIDEEAISPGSDDPDYYTLLADDDYQTMVNETTQILKKTASKISKIDEDYLDEWIDNDVEETIAAIEQYNFAMPVLKRGHRRAIADSFAARFNNPGDTFANSYIDDLLDVDQPFGNNHELAELYKTSSLGNDSLTITLTSDEVFDWLSGFDTPGRVVMSPLVDKQIRENLRPWLLDKEEQLRAHREKRGY